MRLPALFRTTVFQTTLVYMALFGASVLALFTFIYWSTLGYLERQTDEIIEAEIRGLAEQAERRGLAGLATVINVLDPDVIVAGGGLSRIRAIYDDVPARWDRWIFSDLVNTRLLPAAHGDSSGVRGAARLWP